MQRADARSNRERVLTAARETFAAAGLEAPIREVARRAGIGVATLYRHFPTRVDLVTSVLTERVDACAEQMRRALEDPDPWRALSGIVLTFADRQIHDRALNEALLGPGEVAAAFQAERREHAQALNVLGLPGRTPRARPGAERPGRPGPGRGLPAGRGRRRRRTGRAARHRVPATVAAGHQHRGHHPAGPAPPGRTARLRPAGPALPAGLRA